MNMKALAMAIAVVGSGSAVADYEFAPGHHLSANIGMTTDYVFRGVSQTDGNPAVQGGFNYTYQPYNLYAGVWGSNVDSNRGVYLFEDEVSGAHALTAEGLLTQLDDQGIDYTSDIDGNGVNFDYLRDNINIDVLNNPGYEGASVEMDFYAGWAPNIETTYGRWDFDLGYKRYQYFNSDADVDTNEFYAGVGFDFQGNASLSYKAHYSDEYFGLGSAWYHDFRLGIPLDNLVGQPGWSIHANYGITDYTDDNEIRGRSAVATINNQLVSLSPNDYDYADYGAGVAYNSEGWKIDLSWVARSDEDDCVEPFSCDSKAVFMVGKTF